MGHCTCFLIIENVDLLLHIWSGVHHSRHSIVMQALGVFKALRVAAAVVAAATLLTASGLVGGGAKLASVPILALGITAVACCAAWQKLCKQVEKFYFTDYKHSET